MEAAAFLSAMTSMDSLPPSPPPTLLQQRLPTLPLLPVSPVEEKVEVPAAPEAPVLARAVVAHPMVTARLSRWRSPARCRRGAPARGSRAACAFGLWCGGGDGSVVAPCDVWRLDVDGCYLWRLDLQASLPFASRLRPLSPSPRLHREMGPPPLCPIRRRPTAQSPSTGDPRTKVWLRWRPRSRHLLWLRFHASPSEDGRKMRERRENTLKWVALCAIVDFPPLLVLSTGRMNSSIFPLK
jgi:hypothetical protein